MSWRTKSKSGWLADGKPTSISLNPICTRDVEHAPLAAGSIGSISAWLPSRRSTEHHRGPSRCAGWARTGPGARAAGGRNGRYFSKGILFGVTGSGASSLPRWSRDGHGKLKSPLARRAQEAGTSTYVGCSSQVRRGRRCAGASEPWLPERGARRQGGSAFAAWSGGGGRRGLASGAVSRRLVPAGLGGVGGGGAAGAAPVHATAAVDTRARRRTALDHHPTERRSPRLAMVRGGYRPDATGEALPADDRDRRGQGTAHGQAAKARIKGAGGDSGEEGGGRRRRPRRRAPRRLRPARPRHRPRPRRRRPRRPGARRRRPRRRPATLAGLAATGDGASG